MYFQVQKKPNYLKYFLFYRGAEFRQDYGRLAELRSILPDDVTYVALTATATTNMKSQILKKLDMMEEETSVVYELPDRKNITYHVKKSKNRYSELDWLLNDIVNNKERAKKTVVFGRNIVTCANLYDHFNMHIQQGDTESDRLFAMFHRSTAPSNKEHVLQEFTKTDSKLRTVFATVAFGMGVDVPDIDFVVHWGAPRGLEQFAQESGRAGRDGRHSTSIIYYTGRDIAKDRSSNEMREFCKSSTCLRAIMNSHFKLDSKSKLSEKHDIVECLCCSLCFEKCKCGSCVSLDCVMDFSSEMAMLDICDDSVRTLDDYQVELLRANLLDFHDCLVDEGSDIINAYDNSLIESIIQNCNYLMCEDDIIYLGLQNHDLAKEILLLMEEVC